MTTAPFALDPLLAAVRERSTGIGSDVHGELHWRTVGANGLWLAESGHGVDTQVVFLFGASPRHVRVTPRRAERDARRGEPGVARALLPPLSGGPQRKGARAVGS